MINQGWRRISATLLRRHGPLVLHVCRGALDWHLAEDGFQATFLVLGRKTDAIRIDRPLELLAARVTTQLVREVGQISGRTSVQLRPVFVFPAYLFSWKITSMARVAPRSSIFATGLLASSLLTLTT